VARLREELGNVQAALGTAQAQLKDKEQEVLGLNARLLQTDRAGVQFKVALEEALAARNADEEAHTLAAADHAREVDTLRASIDTLKRACGEAQESQSAAEASVKQLELRLREAAAERTTLSERVKELEGTTSQATSELEQLQLEKAALLKERDEARTQASHLEEVVAHATETAHGASVDLNDVLVEKASLTEQRDRLDKELAVRGLASHDPFHRTTWPLFVVSTFSSHFVAPPVCVTGGVCICWHSKSPRHQGRTAAKNGARSSLRACCCF